MKKAKVLFISQEITPYLDETPMSVISRELPQGIQERGKEIRIFMPRFGCINERRNQLHEVIRLSGMNLVVDDTDHPLIIKVASIQSARMQVYFIDNEEYFQRKSTVEDKKAKFHADNDERSIFFCRGVLETVKKLGWAPDIIHCHGWMSSLIPLYIKKTYREDPIFAGSKVVYSVYGEPFDNTLNKDFAKKAMLDGISAADLKPFEDSSLLGITKAATSLADGIIMANETVPAELQKHIKKLNKPVLPFQSPDSYLDAYSEFYDEILESEPALA